MCNLLRLFWLIFLGVQLDDDDDGDDNADGDGDDDVGGGVGEDDGDDGDAADDGDGDGDDGDDGGDDDVGDEINLIALQGPESRRILQEIMPSDVSMLPFYHCIEDKYEDNNILIARTGYTGELGFEIYGNLNVIPKIWDALME